GQGLTGDPVVVKTLWTFGNAYRAALIDPQLRDSLERQLGYAVGEQEATTFARGFFPFCEFCVSTAGWLGGTTGAAVTPPLADWQGFFDPRAETVTWSYWF